MKTKDAEIKIIDESGDIVVIEKPALIDSQNSRAGRPSVVDWLTRRYGFAGLMHRLDFGTSGLMVCAKNPDAARRITRAFDDGAIGKTYLAITFGRMKEDRGEFTSPIGGKPAFSRFRVLERFSNATLAEVDLLTGRKHQIRRHFAEAGFPLVGDRLYGKKGSDRLFHRPALHACKLVISGRTYRSELPDDMAELLARWKKEQRRE